MSITAGTRLGRYEIRSQLGAGGMGEVYLALDTELDRTVAIKILPESPAPDQQRLYRFIQEAKAASALNHPNIITIYEVGQVESVRFIAAEFVDGVTLRRRMSEGQIKLTEALDFAAQVAGALAAAHQAGIVHRDIKPDNVMLRGDALVKVLDFGLAKLTEPKVSTSESPTLVNTKTGIVLGTSCYMSPEQARGLSVDARTDIWSLGVVIYEMIGGRLPFEGATNSDVLAAILDYEPTPLARHAPQIPPELEWMVKKALRKDREERYQTAKELVTDLKNLKHQLEFEAELERSAPPEFKNQATRAAKEAHGSATDTKRAVKPSTLVSPSESWRRGRVPKILLALAVILVIGGLTYLWWKFVQETKEATPLRNASFTQLTDQPGPEFFPSLSLDGKTLIYAGRASGNWDIYLQRVGGRNLTNLTKDSSNDDTQPAFSPDGERIAFRSERDGGGIYLMGATGESVIRLSDFGYSPAWSPDGEQIVVGTEKVPQPSTRPTRSQLWTIEIKSGERRLITEGDALQPNWSPQWRRIAYWSRPSTAGQREEIWTIPADGGQAVAVTNGSTTDLNPVWSPDGKYLYFSSNRGGSMNIWRVSMDEKSGAVLGQPEPVTTIGATSSPLHFSFSRDGRRLAYTAQQEVRNLRSVAFDPSSGKVTGDPTAITRGSTQLWFPDPSPEGEWLACYSMGEQRHVFTIRTDGTDLRDLTDDSDRHHWPRWSPDGKRIAFSSRRTGNYELWAINSDGSGVQQLTQHPGAHYGIWSPDGARMAYSIHTPKNDCIIFQPDQPWNDQTLEHLAPLPDPSLSFEAWSWSPDGKKLAGIRHLPNGIHSGFGAYDLESKTYDWLTDFGDWPVWLTDNRRLLFVSQGKVLVFDTRTRKSQPVYSVTDEDVDIGSLGLSKDNRVIYFTYVATEADLWLMTLE